MCTGSVLRVLLAQMQEETWCCHTPSTYIKPWIPRTPLPSTSPPNILSPSRPLVVAVADPSLGAVCEGVSAAVVGRELLRRRVADGAAAAPLIVLEHRAGRETGLLVVLAVVLGEHRNAGAADDCEDLLARIDLVVARLHLIVGAQQALERACRGSVTRYRGKVEGAMDMRADEKRRRIFTYVTDDALQTSLRELDAPRRRHHQTKGGAFSGAAWIYKL